MDLYSSYYGGVTCVCWSPDGRFLLTGGQDDLLSLWSFEDRELVARCAGHHSWITSVAFDPWKSDDRTYRFGSVGEDCRLLLWDFSIGMLHKPRAVSLAPVAHPRILHHADIVFPSLRYDRASLLPHMAPHPDDRVRQRLLASTLTHSSQK